jgi:hypothetical protein
MPLGTPTRRAPCHALHSLFHQYADPAHPLGLLRLRRKRPRSRRAERRPFLGAHPAKAGRSRNSGVIEETPRVASLRGFSFLAGNQFAAIRIDLARKPPFRLPQAPLRPEGGAFPSCVWLSALLPIGCADNRD